MQNNVKTQEQKTNFMTKVSKFFRLDSNKSKVRKALSSVWALVIGIFVALLFIFIQHISTYKNVVDAIGPFFKSLWLSFKDDQINKILWEYFIVYGFCGLACAIGFKSGLFNIGISGQMMVFQIVVFPILFKHIALGSNLHGGHLIWMFLLGAISGFAVASIAGILKAYLKVHEVISTIMLNWIIVYLIRYLFNVDNNFFPGMINASLKGATKSKLWLLSDDTIKVLRYSGTFILLGSVMLLVFIYEFTTLGYKLKMIGLSKTNGKYIGSNEKLLTVMVLSFSGMLAGIGGFYWYVLRNTLTVKGEVLGPIGAGFDSIAVALLALNTPIGIMFTSLFYSTITASNGLLQDYPVYLDPQHVQIVNSIILYFAAISLIFMKFKPFKFIKYSIIKWSHKSYWARVQMYFVELAMIIKFKSYKQKQNKLLLKINESNKDDIFTKLDLLENKFNRQRDLLEIKQTYYQSKINLLNEIDASKWNYEHYKTNKAWELREAKKDLKNNRINQEEFSQNKFQIEELVKNKKQEFLSLMKNNNEKLKALKIEFNKSMVDAKNNPKQYSFDRDSIAVLNESKKALISKEKQAYKLQTQSMYSKLKSISTSNAETIAKFAEISKIKKDYLNKIDSLGVNNHKNIRLESSAKYRILNRNYSSDTNKIADQWNKYCYIEKLDYAFGIKSEGGE